MLDDLGGVLGGQSLDIFLMDLLLMCEVALIKYHMQVYLVEPYIFLRICTHTQTITISNDLCPPMPTHGIQIAPMY
jgi:hypothetical protein